MLAGGCGADCSAGGRGCLAAALTRGRGLLLVAVSYGGSGLVNRGSVELRFNQRGLPLCSYSQTTGSELQPLILCSLFSHCRKKRNCELTGFSPS